MIAHAKNFQELERGVLFVGGPLDGQRIVTRDDLQYYDAPVLHGWSRIEPSWELVTYRRERFRCGDAIWHFYVENSLTMEDLATILFGSLPHERR